MINRVKIFMSAIICSVLLATTIPGMDHVYAHDTEVDAETSSETLIIGKEVYEKLPEEGVEIVLNELELEVDQLTDEEVVAYLTRASGSVWNQTYSNVNNVKKALTMSGYVFSSNDLPYTRITITNNGKNTITAIAYKGEVLGSTTIRSMSVGAGTTKTMTVTRSDVMKYGTYNGQGTTSYLAYNVSLYNQSGGNISCKAVATRYY